MDNISGHSNSSQSDDLVFVLSVCLVIIEILGLLCNGIILTVYFKYSKLRTATNLFILNLAVCNLLLAVLQLVLSTPSFFRKEWLYDESGCVAYGFAHQYLISVAVITLAVIAFDRFCVITKPTRKLKTFILTKSRARTLICASHVYSLVFTLPLLFGWNKLTPDRYFKTGCYIGYSHQSPSSMAYTITSTIFTCILPFIVTSCCYAKIYQSVRKSSRRCTLYRNQHNTVCKETGLRNKSLYHTRTARMIWTVMFFFLLTWLPTRSVGLVAAFGCSVPPLAAFVCVFLTKSCVMYNAVVYVFLNHRFRAAFLHLTFVCREDSRLRFTTDATNASARNFGEILPSIVDAGDRSKVLMRKSLSQLNFIPAAAKIPEISSGSGRLSNAEFSLPTREPPETSRKDSIYDRTSSHCDRHLSEDTFRIDRAAWSNGSANGSRLNIAPHENEIDRKTEHKKERLEEHLPTMGREKSELNNELSCIERRQSLSHVGPDSTKTDHKTDSTEPQKSTSGQRSPDINNELDNAKQEITTISEQDKVMNELKSYSNAHKALKVNYGFNNPALYEEDEYSDSDKTIEKYLELDIRSLSNIA